MAAELPLPVPLALSRARWAAAAAAIALSLRRARSLNLHRGRTPVEAATRVLSLVHAAVSAVWAARLLQAIRND